MDDLTPAAADIHAIDPAHLLPLLPALSQLLKAVVDDGASVSFVQPFSIDAADRFWTLKVAPAVMRGERVLLVAFDNRRVVGSVQLDLDTPPNQPHRAEVSKLLVHPDWRLRGIARALMTRLIDTARARGRTLITLDTRTGDKAEPLYASLGFRSAGVIPGYARDAQDPQKFDGTTYMYLSL